MNAKRFVFFVLCMFMAFSVFCQSNLAWHHSIGVKRISWWGKSFLTVTANYGGAFLEPLEVDSVGRAYLLDPKDIIISINSVSTEDMSEEEFYRILDNNEFVTLRFKNFFVAEELEVKYRQINRYYKGTSEIAYLMEYGRKYNNRLPETIKIFRDDDIDFYKFRSFDFVFTSSQPLKEKTLAKKIEKILEDFSWLTRDTDSPDLLIKISFSQDESTSSTYVPPSTRVVNTGSTTEVKKGIFSGKPYLETMQHNRYVHEGGYTQTTIDNDLFLELSFLDASKVNDVAQTIPPVVWQMVYKQHLNQNLDITDMDWMLSWVGLYPEIKGSSSIKTSHKRYSGLCFGMNGEISDVFVGSPAEMLGLKPGDIILRINKKKVRFARYSNGLRPFIDYESVPIDSDCSVLVKRNKKKVELKGRLYEELPNFQDWKPQ